MKSYLELELLGEKWTNHSVGTYLILKTSLGINMKVVHRTKFFQAATRANKGPLEMSAIQSLISELVFAL